MRHETALLNAVCLDRLAGVSGPFAGNWKNELKSTMSLEVNGSRVKGRYTSVESETGKIATGLIVGTVNGNIITFVVDWDGLAATTTWSGQLVEIDGEQKIQTLWLLNKYVDGTAKELWQTTLIGTDTFTSTR